MQVTVNLTQDETDILTELNITEAAFKQAITDEFVAKIKERMATAKAKVIENASFTKIKNALG